MTPYKINLKKIFQNQMNRLKKNSITYLIAIVWLANGLFCKIFNLVPRHQEIVARILGDDYAFIFTKAIGLAEIVMAVWIFSKFSVRLNAITQITIIAVMNALEFFLASDLLLWGRWNALFALIFILVIYYNAFLLDRKKA